LVVGELSDQEQLKSVIREHNVSGVMHFAASIEAGKSMKVPSRARGAYGKASTQSVFDENGQISVGWRLPPPPLRHIPG
jgi:UDP-glucose 4-epimerase